MGEVDSARDLKLHRSLRISAYAWSPDGKSIAIARRLERATSSL